MRPEMMKTLSPMFAEAADNAGDEVSRKAVQMGATDVEILNGELTGIMLVFSRRIVLNNMSVDEGMDIVRKALEGTVTAMKAAESSSSSALVPAPAQKKK